MNKKNISFTNQNKLKLFSFIFIFLTLIIFLLTINKIVKALDEYDNYADMQKEEGTDATLQQILSDFRGENELEVKDSVDADADADVGIGAGTTTHIDLSQPDDNSKKTEPPETITIEEDSKVDITTPTIIEVKDDDNTYNILADGGSFELKDGELLLSAGMIFTTEDLKIVTSTEDGTKIKFVDGNVEVTGHISVDYENSPNKIILIGEDSSIEVQIDEDEKFEFKNTDDTKLIVNIGSFHDSEECKGKNCISYQEMGVGTSGEEWNKLKVDGNAIITKTITKYENEKKTEEKIYEINFKDGKTKLSRDLSKLENTEFNQKTVINYNSGGITLFIKTSEKEGEDRITAGSGEFTNVDIVTKAKTVELPEIPILPKTPKPSGTDSELKEKASGVYIDDKTLYDTVKEKGEDLMSENLILAWIEQESSMSQDAELGGCVGFTQVSAISFRDVINRNPEKYKKYLSYTNEELTEALKDDALLNLEIGFDYMNSLKTTYGFSQEKVESNYKYTGNEEDIMLMAYNAGPTVTKDILTEFKNNGGGNWDELEEFLHTKDALNIFKKYKGSYGIKDTDTEEEVNYKLERKINIVINYVKNIKKNAGYT